MTDSTVPPVPPVPPVRRDPSDRRDDRFSCEQCGAKLVFTPGSTQVACTHCGHVQSIDIDADPDTAHVEHDFEAVLRNLTTGAAYEEHKVLTCPSCGAQTEFPEGTQAAACPFCDTPFVTDTGTHRQIKPAGLVPFQIDERTARTAMTTWLGRLWFAPNGLQDYARKGRAMTGIYVPYWTFDADTTTAYTGQRGDAYYETQRVTVNGKSQTRQVRKISWSRASGRVARFFNDVLVLASRSLPKRYTDALEPWNLAELKTYQPQFLSGFAAEGYQIELPDGFTDAQGIMARQIEVDIRHDIGGDEQRVSSVDTDTRDITFKHILLPIWMAAYKYRDKTYRFVVNGQSGKVQGERPWSWIKITIAVILGLIVAGGIGYMIYINQDPANLPRF